jgi:two-component system, OmpR family, phosphate regulon sensor histidine kinase PhoR
MTLKFEPEHVLHLLEALPDPALIVAENGEIIAANTYAEDFFEVSPLGKHLATILRTPAVLQAVNEAVLRSKSSQVQHLVRTPVPRTYDAYVSPLGFRNAFIMLRDLTYAEQIERMRSDFVANASHELRTPLASLTGFIDTLQGAAKNDPKATAEFLKMMKAQADRMATLIDDLLSLSRIEISEHVAPTSITDLAMITKQACDLLTSVAADSNCELRVDLPPSLKVIGDSHQLSQVVHNLIENAIKYAGLNKSVEVYGRIENQEAILTIRDHGPGIAAHHVPRLTERFYRVNVQDSRSRGGTGLGLAIAKHILNRHRGKLAIESKLGQGSQFSIHLQIEN